MGAAHTHYESVLRWSLTHRLPVFIGAVVLLVLAGLLATRLGTEFLPSLDEGDVAIQALRIPGTSLSQSVAMQEALEQRLAAVPEVQRVFSRIGTAEVANDPMPPSIADVFVMLKAREDWPDPRKPKNALLDELAKALLDHR